MTVKNLIFLEFEAVLSDFSQNRMSNLFFQKVSLSLGSPQESLLISKCRFNECSDAQSVLI
jgi:hypothetical protein